MAKSRFHYDASGTFDLSTVHSVTPYKTVKTINDPIRNEPVKVPALVGTLHYHSGHTLTTDTPYEDLVKKVFEVNHDE